MNNLVVSNSKSQVLDWKQRCGTNALILFLSIAYNWCMLNGEANDKYKENKILNNNQNKIGNT